MRMIRGVHMVAGMIDARRRIRGVPALLLLLWAGGAAAQTAPVITPVPRPPVVDAGRRALGKALFESTLLSAGGTRSCASCHDVVSNGADARVRDPTPAGRLTALNSPTVFNAALSFRLNWEGNARTLADQAEMALASPEFMASSDAAALAAIGRDAGLVAQFRSAYGHGPTREAMLDAIATYEETLLTPDSRFDRFLRGDAAALDEEELQGYALFTSLGCVACHQGVNVGGNLWEPHGIFSPLAAPDPARLRVPSLRNVATTAPYFHDGSAPTLGDAVDAMARAQLGRSLTPEQSRQIVAFLGTLTGEYQGRPVHAPAP
jgi:cytochrome c peroxidase